ncbi:MAG: hypothetical protein M0Z99_01960 [Betaproteobacteria bacterium]|nr:hypothetical protein [Betaproteobacteria bacterium]
MTNDWRAYERRKAAWIAAHPHATPEQYEQAARREFRLARGARVAAGESRPKLPTRELIKETH